MQNYWKSGLYTANLIQLELPAKPVKATTRLQKLIV